MSGSTATYVIEQRGAEWCLFTHDHSRLLGSHPTKDEADAQERAVQARTHSQADLFALQGVEIFKAGTWNGDKYTTADLDAMVAASHEVGFTPPIKFGHDSAGGAPALGWVENLRRAGDKLLGDLVAMPKLVYEAIRQRSYDRVSAEIYWDIERGGKKFSRVLRALALLGSDVPAVDLAPLAAFFALPHSPQPPAVSFQTYAVEIHAQDDPGRKPMADDTKLATLEATIAELTAQLTAARAGGEIVLTPAQQLEYQQAKARLKQLEALETELKTSREQVTEAEAELREARIRQKVASLRVPAFRFFVRAFYELAQASDGAAGAKTYTLPGRKDANSAEAVVDAWLAEMNKQADRLFVTYSVTTEKADVDEPEEPGAKVGYRVDKYLREHKLDRVKDYRAALDAVLAADPDLKTAYAARV